MVEGGESSGPVTSEHSLDQKLTLNLKEDHEVEADVPVGLPEEKPQLFVSPPDTQEIHVKILIFFNALQVFVWLGFKDDHLNLEHKISRNRYINNL